MVEYFHCCLCYQSPDAATKEALNYRAALYQGYQSLADRPICTATAERVCSVIKSRSMTIRKEAGTALGSTISGDTIYTPPVGESVIREMLANWENFINQTTELDPLVVMAVAHYQFEAIHPFSDGNGRAGRVLNLLYLVQAGILSSPILYHSRGIIRRKDDYYDLLRTVTFDQDWEAWILFILEVIEESAEWTNQKIRSIREYREEVREELKIKVPKIYSNELLDVLFEQPYCQIADLVSAGIAKRQSASVYLKKLVEIGLLAEERVGRSALFIHENYRNLLLSER